ncbi:DNA topoisomerase IV subunit A [Lacibacterium aquatile]|uniref:DNA topoisomerase 4 subunit A n=1 Tax=Lacibacterium aquatile TaxID=1168082 RepID=A0ABW5DPC7_9PROT
MTDISAADLRDTPLTTALSERYLSYALSTIMARSLPDVRDGLKPVHRRLLFAMRELGLDPRSGYKKAARVVGDVIGKFHPHGDIAVYEALVRLAQDFAVRYPLVDGQGNFGNIDGDSAAAMRYTEARLTEVAQLLLEGLDENAVDMRRTYDGELEEPVVMPSAFPNLLANGATGIAVGMATNIPPHNAYELSLALRQLIADRDTPVAALLTHVQGPDFPTGGIIVDGPDVIRQAYETGRGSFRTRARWEEEKLKNGLWQIVITEIPYQVAKSRLIERIADLLNEKKLTLLGDVRDESTELVRVVLEPKSRNVDPAILMESLFKQTDLESRFSMNLNVLDRDGIPRVMSLKDALVAFLDHRHEVLIRRSEFRKEQIERRLEILKGYLIAYLNIDEIIRIIREEDEPKTFMMEAFSLTEIQAEAILNMRLRSLRRLEEITIKREFDQLSAELAELVGLLGDASQRWKAIDGEIVEMGLKFGPETALGKRRTTFAEAMSFTDVPVEALIEREPITVICSDKGWARAVKGHDVDPNEIKYKDGDGPRFLLKAETTDKLLIFATDGKFYTLAADKLPRGRGFGEPLRLSIDLPNDQDMLTLQVHKPGGRLLVAANDGKGFIVKEEDAVAQTRSGKQVMVGREDAKPVFCVPATHSHLAVIGENRKILIMPTEEVPEMTRGQGVMLQKYKDGGLSDVRFMDPAEGLSFPFGGRVRTVADLSPWLGKRASSGRLAPVGFPRNNKFAKE